MTRATCSPRFDSVMTLADGRQLAYAEWGDPSGKPVVFIHGMPASRLFCPDEDATIAAGVRLITIDRPGYGRSDPRPDRVLLDWPADFVELADQLDLPACPVIGWSAGGRNALVIGLRVPERVTAIGIVVAPGPIDQVPGAIEELDPEERTAFRLLASDRAAGLALVSGQSTWLDGDGWKTMFAGTWGESDDDVLSDPGTREAMEVQTREGARQGRVGYEADLLEAFTPWGFSSRRPATTGPYLVRRVRSGRWSEPRRLSRRHDPGRNTRELSRRRAPHPDPPLGRDAGRLRLTARRISAREALPAA